MTKPIDERLVVIKDNHAARTHAARAKAGTPKSLEQAIRFGINIESDYPADERCALAGMVEPYVVDFLSQRFAAAMLLAGSDEGGGEEQLLQNLWQAITGKKL